MILLKKLKQEVGLAGIVRVPFIFINLIIFNIKLRLYSKGKFFLKKDLEIVKDNYYIFKSTLQKFFTEKNKDYSKSTLDWIIKNSEKRNYYSTVRDLSTFTPNVLDKNDEERINYFLDINVSERTIRSHKLNKGKNDLWEYYLTPWHRLIVYFSFLFWDPRFTESCERLFKFYRKWYKEFIWFSAIGTKSNIFTVQAGLALHCLNEFYYSGNPKYLNKFQKHVLRLKYFLDTAFENGIPMEGNLYGKFSLINVIYLDQVYRSLGKVLYFSNKFNIINNTFIDEYASYLEMAWTRTQGFETSGDSYHEKDRLILPEIIIYFSKRSNKKIFKEILNYYKPKDLYYKLIKL